MVTRIAKAIIFIAAVLNLHWIPRSDKPKFIQKDSDLAIAFEDAEDDHFYSGSPSSFALPMAVKHSLIAFYRSFDWFGALLRKCQNSSNKTKEFFGCRPRRRSSKSQPIGWNPENEKFQQFSLGSLAQSHCVPHRAESIPFVALAGFESVIRQFPCPVMTTVWTSSSHR